jgi:two-component system response regulator VicR
MAKKVLVVDDHAPTVALIRDALTPYGYEVIGAGNGAECVERVEDSEPDLLILDVHMPVLNGFDALRLLRQRGDESLPVIILSGRGDFSDVRKGWKRGADIYLTKPVKVGAVVAAVRWLLREEEEAGPPAVAERELLSTVVASDL